MRSILKNNRHSELHDASMLVGWYGDSGRLGEVITDRIIHKLNGQLLYEIDPEAYFQLGGVTVEDDLVQFPESKFFICPNHNLIVFRSTPPSYEFFNFISQVLDFAKNECNVKSIYAIGSLVALSSHSVPRTLIGTYSTAGVKEDLSDHDIESDSTFETPPGQKPTLNSFLLWASRRKDLAGIGLWVPIPFYLVSLDDPKAQKRIMEFLNRRFKFEIDLGEFDISIIKQNRKINEIRNLNSEIDSYLVRIENNLKLSEDENVKLVSQVSEYLKS